jgi:DNA repair exonuclease SbcCD ATPase subunit
MKLLRARLHPFGKFADASWDLTQPLVVVHGPNELGKSTLRHAIVHALFTPTNLTTARQKQTVKPWFPLPTGDHAAVTLTFEHDGKTWTLEKHWGAGHSCTLSDGTNSIADPSSVQSQLAGMLAHDEATFRHVLFTGQAELEQTLSAIKANSTAIRDIRDVMKLAADATGDVDEQKLRRVLEAKITAAFSRWDDARERPERQNGQERDCRNPWRREVGTILAAWYAWQRLVEEREAILGIEQEIDRVNLEAAAVEREIREHDAFVQRYGSLRSGLADRAHLEERVPRLEEQVASMREAFGAWPTAKASVEAWGTQRPDLEAQIARLRQEREHAEARRAGAATASAFERIAQAHEACEAAVTRANSLTSPGLEQLAEIARLEKAITHTESVLAARTLSWRIESDGPATVSIAQGSDPADTIPVGPEGVRGEAQAMVVVRAAGLTFSVASGTDDVASLFQSLAADRQKLTDLLAACGAESPDGARLAAQHARDARADAASKKHILDGFLQGKTRLEWEAAVAALAALPATRDLAAINAEMTACQSQRATGDAVAAKHAEAMASWVAKYTDMASLGEQLLEAQSELRKAKERFAAMPELPPGFATVKAFLDALDEAEGKRREAERRMSAAREALAGLAAKLGDRRSEDVAEAADAARRGYDRALGTGRSYLRIREELNRITAETGDNPVAAFAEKVAAMFSRITGSPATLGFEDGQLPTSVVRGEVALAPERLSQGGGGALALAVRLAMAEAYLTEGDGFIILDDPLVHFDAERMAVAAAIIRQFASRSQVIYFTCHDHHAEALSRPADQARA